MSTFDPMRHSGGTPFYKGIRVEGVDQLMKNLRKLLTSHTEAEIRKALTPATKIIITAAKAKARVARRTITFKLEGGGELTLTPGLLRDSIKVLPKWNQDPLGVYVGPKVSRRRRAKATAQAFYAHWIEYGTDPHSLGYKGKYVTGKGAKHPGTQKYPYMRPAYDETKEAVMNKMFDGIIAMLESKHF